MSDIVVVGSMNMDFVVAVERYPQRGETIIGNNFLMTPGGKGANQAATIGNLGGDVSFISACGKDIFGDKLMANLQSFGVNVDHVLRFEDTTTGIASITLENKGENRIVVVPGANNKLTVSTINHLTEEIIKAQVVLLQLEIPLETVIRTIEIAHEHNIKVVLDPAPARKLPEEIYRKIDYILPNEGEIEQLCADYKLKTEKEKISKLLDLGVGAILITKGEHGVTYYSAEKTITQPAIKTEVVDTTGAGDVFAGAFAFGLQKGWALEDIIKFATCVAGLSVTKQGAQSSIPTLAEVKAAFRAMDHGACQKLFQK